MTKTPAVTSNKSIRRSVVVLGLLGVALLCLYRVGVRAEGTKDIAWFLKIVAVQTPFYLIASLLILRSKPSQVLFILVVSFAALFRLSILFAPPYLSDDVYRYIWDGRVQAAGINPYRYIPADDSLAHLRDERIYSKINRRYSAPTMYPPIAEGVFFITTRVSESVTWMKATMVGFEAVAVWAIVQLLESLGLARQRVLIYAWHPLAVWEFAGSGHLDAMAIAFIALALLVRSKRAEAGTGVALACATLVKFFPAILFAPLYKLRSWKMPLAFALTIVIAYLPYLNVGASGALGYLPGYARERGMTSGEQFFVLVMARRLSDIRMPAWPYLMVSVLVLLAVSLWIIYTRQPPDKLGYLRSSLLIASLFMVLLSPHFAWYFAWIIPFLCFIPSPSVFYLTLSSFLLYLTWLDWSDGSVFKIKAMIFLPFLVLLALELWRNQRRRQLAP